MKLTVRNLAQKVLFLRELRGQLSDGHWENATPGGHWRPWCQCKVVVGDDVGRDFHAPRDRYRFDDPGLLEIVGRRMMVYVRLAMGFGEADGAVLEDLFDLGGEWRGLPADAGEHWNGARAKLCALGLDKLGLAKDVAANELLYCWKRLLADLKDLKKIVRTAR